MADKPSNKGGRRPPPFSKSVLQTVGQWERNTVFSWNSSRDRRWVYLTCRNCPERGEVEWGL